MSVSSQSNRASYIGTGSVTTFAFSPPFQMTSDLTVLTTDPVTGIQSTKAITTDYTVTGTTDSAGFFPNGGSVNFNVAPASGIVVTIFRDPPLTQTVVHVDGGQVTALSLDGPSDKLTMIAIRDRELISRSLRQPDGDVTALAILPPSVTRANGGLGSVAGYDGNGQPTVFPSAANGVQASTAMATVITQSTLALARTAMAVVGTGDIGTSVQAHDADLDTLAALTTAAGNFGQVPMVAQAGGFVLAGPLSEDTNLVVNPAMDIDQANEAASVAVATTTSKYITDQWQVAFTGAATGVTGQQVADAPPGLKNSLKVAVGTGSATVNAGDSLIILQNIEGLDCIDLAFGGASAKALSLGFWVKSSITGTFGYALRNSANNRSMVGTFAIAQAATWQFVPVAGLAGDTTGTWLTTNGVGLSLAIVLMAGSTFQGTAGAWSASNLLTTSSQTNLAATSANTFQLTGVKVQQGPNVTPLVRRKQQVELARCQRYYEKTYDSGVTLGTVTTAGEFNLTLNNSAAAVYAAGGFDRFKMSKRATPTITTFSPATGTSGKIRDTQNAADVTPTLSDQSLAGFSWTGTANASASNVKMTFHWTADARL